MILTDTGPLVALFNSNDPKHSLCDDALNDLPDEPLITTWPCISEAMYMLGKASGHSAQDELWEWIVDGEINFHPILPASLKRMRELMRQYKDTPMDFADSSLVAAAEELNTRRIFTIDTDFYVYRISGKHAFEVLPARH